MRNNSEELRKVIYEMGFAEIIRAFNTAEIILGNRPPHTEPPPGK